MFWFRASRASAMEADVTVHLKADATSQGCQVLTKLGSHTSVLSQQYYVDPATNFAGTPAQEHSAACAASVSGSGEHQVLALLQGCGAAVKLVAAFRCQDALAALNRLPSRHQNTGKLKRTPALPCPPHPYPMLPSHAPHTVEYD